jgi:hypothetical protein
MQQVHENRKILGARYRLENTVLYKECENRPWKKNINRTRQYLMCADDVVLEIAVTHNAETGKDVTNVASQLA